MLATITRRVEALERQLADMLRAIEPEYLPPCAPQFRHVSRSALRTAGKSGRIRRKRVGGSDRNPRFHYHVNDAREAWPDVILHEERQRAPKSATETPRAANAC